jgi:ribonucrease Y
MESIIGVVVGFLVGGGASFFIVKRLSDNKSQLLIDEANKTADLTVKEAKLTAQRLVSEAESKSSNLVEKAEIRNEQIKQQKIQEAREKFNQMKADFETQKAKQMVDFKDREVQIVAKEGA